MTLPALALIAVLQGWSPSGGEPFEAELKHFNFEQKSVALITEERETNTVPTRDLSVQNRIQVLLSPKFVAAYPRDHWHPGQSRYVLLCALVPAFYFLFGFWLSAALLLKRANPVKAIIAFVGGWLLGLLLIGAYVTFASRDGAPFGGIMTFGIVLTSVFVSMFISVIYETTSWNGFLVFFCHLFLAAILMAISAFTVSKAIDPAHLDSFLTRHVFTPTGLMAEKTVPSLNEEGQ